MTYRSRKLWVNLANTQAGHPLLVDQIGTTNRRDKTARGIHVGSTDAQVRAAYHLHCDAGGACYLGQLDRQGNLFDFTFFSARFFLPPKVDEIRVGTSTCCYG